MNAFMGGKGVGEGGERQGDWGVEIERGKERERWEGVRGETERD